jgi:hypothetical protein
MTRNNDDIVAQILRLTNKFSEDELKGKTKVQLRVILDGALDEVKERTTAPKLRSFVSRMGSARDSSDSD